MKRLTTGFLMFAIAGMLGLVIYCPDAKAEGLSLKDLPAIKQGFVYSISSDDIFGSQSIEVLNYKDLTLDAGYYRGDDADKDTGFLALAYRLGGLEKLGINTPISKFFNVSVGYYIGASRVKASGEFQHGAYLSLVRLQF